MRHDLMCVWSVSRLLGFIFSFFACVYQFWRAVLKPLLCLICGFVSEEDILNQHAANAVHDERPLQHTQENWYISAFLLVLTQPVLSYDEVCRISFIMRRVCLFICKNRSLQYFAFFFFFVCVIQFFSHGEGI